MWTSTIKSKEFRNGRLYVTVAFSNSANAELDFATQYQVDSVSYLVNLVDTEISRLNSCLALKEGLQEDKSFEEQKVVSDYRTELAAQPIKTGIN